MGSGNIMDFLPMILIFVVAYFFMIRPQMKRQKDEKKFAAKLKRGDKIIHMCVFLHATKGKVPAAIPLTKAVEILADADKGEL